MKTLFHLAIVAAMLGLSANASALIINLGGGDFTADSGGTGSLGGSGADLPDNALVLTFVNNGTDTVRLTIDGANLPVGTGKLSDVWFNLDPSLNITSFTYVSGVVAQSTSTGSFNVGGGAGNFDVLFEYSPAGPTGDFFSGSSSVYDLVGAGLTESLFNFLSSGASPLAAAFHLNITGNVIDDEEQGGHYGATSVIPIPAALWLFGSSLLGLAAFKRTRENA